VAALSAIVSSCFGTFHLLATEEIGKQIHSSIKTMYLGVVFMLIGPIAIMIWEPSYFKVWEWKEFTLRKLAFECLLSAIFYVATESLSTAIENLDVSTSSTFLYLSVLGFTVGDKMIQALL
jgi:drug/metabolite transporter (DMT)-like permease